MAVKHQTRPPKLYSLRKSRQILKWAYRWYQKHWNEISRDDRAFLEETLESLDNAILSKDRSLAYQLATQVEKFGSGRFKKRLYEYFFEILLALILALTIATVVRQMWFELYEIPTGSMRPTFEEKDHVLVSKTTFGINIPLQTQHFYFDPSQVQRTGIVIFSGENLDLPDIDTTYLGIFPYKKRYIKRCMGKPGDSLYFYGGKIYGIDKEGKEIQGLLESPWLENLDHTPFLTFEGKLLPGSSKPSGLIDQFFFQHMNLSIGRLRLLDYGDMVGEIFDGEKWVVDDPTAQKSHHNQLKTYSDFFGMRNYAMARLLTKAQVGRLTGVDPNSMEEGILYLELRHTPSLTSPNPRFVRSEGGRINLILTPHVTVIPLQEKHLQAIMEHMYTARFVVVDGLAKKYDAGNSPFSRDHPSLPTIPDGTYEFYYGKAYQIQWGGIASVLLQDHPLYQQDPSHIQKLFNLGMEMLTTYSPSSQDQASFPFRYAYFRDGDLYLLGAPILSKKDPTLVNFHEREKKREEEAPANRPYIAFRDYGPPLKDGKIDREWIQTFGVTIPEKHYLVLGDNHAMSSDSRIFGFVPQENLQGTPSLILWPPGHRWGFPNQKPYPLLTPPRLIVWTTLLLVGGSAYLIYRHRQRKSIFKRKALVK